MNLEEVGKALAAKVKDALDPMRHAVEEMRANVMAMQKEIETLKAQVEALENVPPPEPGRDGVNGKDGAPGRDGIDGKNGEDGKDGLDGLNGKDAVDIEILPSIDKDKNYPRGTYAIHKGGIWRAYQQATGEHGWECLVAGIADVQLEFTDDDRLKVDVYDSTGKVYSIERTVPMLHYRGLYSSDETYTQGDLTTYDGATWIADKDAPEGVPGRGETDWTLVVKRGRDGRSILDIAKKEWGFKGSGRELLEKLYSGKNPDAPVKS